MFQKKVVEKTKTHIFLTNLCTKIVPFKEYGKIW